MELPCESASVAVRNHPWQVAQSNSSFFSVPSGSPQDPKNGPHGVWGARPVIDGFVMIIQQACDRQQLFAVQMCSMSGRSSLRVHLCSAPVTLAPRYMAVHIPATSDYGLPDGRAPTAPVCETVFFPKGRTADLGIRNRHPSPPVQRPIVRLIGTTL